MKKIAFYAVLLVFIAGCQSGNYRHARTQAKESDIRGTSDDYYAYLDRIISWQNAELPRIKTGLVFPIKVHYVSPLLGTSLYSEDFSETLQYLNQTFASTGVQFALDGPVDYLHSNQNLDVFFHNMELEDWFTKESYHPNVINLYIFSNSDQVVGFTHYPSVNLQRIFISKDYLLDPSLIHEIGHYFGLLHTFENSSDTLFDVNKCQENGDKICDTPPDPVGGSFIEKDCQLFGEYTDANGVVFTPDLTNFMSYYGKCRVQFSPQQRERMYFIAHKIKWSQLRIKV